MRELKRIVQVAGITDEETARMLVECGVIYFGFPLRVPEHSLSIPEDEAAGIIAVLPDDAMPVVITYIDNAKETIEFCDYLGVKGVQVHGDMPVDEFRLLREMKPDLLITKSLVIGRKDFGRTLEDMKIYSEWADLFITDTYDPSTGRYGATGIAHDWELSKKIVELSPCPVILAGGLNPSNVRAAINEVRPWGVDAHTGLDKNGRKDPDLVRAFLSEAMKGFDDIGL